MYYLLKYALHTNSLLCRLALLAGYWLLLLLLLLAVLLCGISSDSPSKLLLPAGRAAVT
jgi:hypothetical protein